MNQLILGGAAVGIMAAFFLGGKLATDRCEARHLKEKEKTEQQIDEVQDKEADSGREVLEVRLAFETKVKELEDEVDRLSGVCRVGPDGLRILGDRWSGR